MDTTTLFLILFDIFLWVALVITRSVSITPDATSAFEIKRRLKDHDPEAVEIASRNLLLPRVNTVKRMVDIILTITITIVSIAAAGLLLGAIVTLTIVMAVDRLSNLSSIKRYTHRIQKRYEASFLLKIQPMSWLDHFAASPEVIRAPHLSSKEELLDLVSRAPDILSRNEVAHIKSAMLLESSPVGRYMTPYSSIDTIDSNDTIGPLVLDQLHKTGHSRFPVIQDDGDHIVGILYMHDLITLRSPHSSVRAAMRPDVHYIRDDQTLEHALHGFLHTHHDLFIVVDTSQVTVGLLTLQDVIKALLGYTIDDSFDAFDDRKRVPENQPPHHNQPKGNKTI